MKWDSVREACGANLNRADIVWKIVQVPNVPIIIKHNERAPLRNR